jgi:hypothetical protein
MNNLNQSIPEEVNWDSSDEDENNEDTSNINNSESDSESDSDIEDTKEKNKSDSILKQIDCKVDIFYLKIEGDRKARTYISGLQTFIKDPHEEKKIAKSIQKNLSTGYYKRINEDQSYHHGFNGDYKLRIKNLLITLYNIPKDKIFIKG